jgi:hypothetical protein
MLAVLTLGLSLVSTGCGTGKVIDSAGNKYNDKTRDFSWTEPPTTQQISHMRAYLKNHPRGTLPADKRPPSSWKLAIVAQIGISEGSVDLWHASLTLQNSDSMLTSRAEHTPNPPIKSLKDLAFIEPGDFIAYNPDDKQSIRKKSVKIIQKHAVTVHYGP